MEHRRASDAFPETLRGFSVHSEEVDEVVEAASGSDDDDDDDRQVLTAGAPLRALRAHTETRTPAACHPYAQQHRHRSCVSKPLHARYVATPNGVSPTAVARCGVFSWVRQHRKRRLLD